MDQLLEEDVGVPLGLNRGIEGGNFCLHKPVQEFAQLSFVQSIILGSFQEVLQAAGQVQTPGLWGPRHRSAAEEVIRNLILKLQWAWEAEPSGRVQTVDLLSGFQAQIGYLGVQDVRGCR